MTCGDNWFFVSLVLRLSCLLWWNEHQTLFFLARRHSNDKTEQIMCYVRSVSMTSSLVVIITMTSSQPSLLWSLNHLK